MENKYYELITELVKNHRKYPGLEAILEDIVLDVQERAKVVLNNITNTEIVESYLTKIVSTSIITVPKKLNYDTKVRHRVINNENLYKELKQDIEIINEQESLEEFLEDVVEKNDTFEEIITDENINTEENDANARSNDIDISLVDKMINGISSTKEDFEAEDSDDNIIELDEIDSIELDENSDLQEEIVKQDEESIEVQDELIEQDEELIVVQDELIEEDEELIEVQDELIEQDEELIEVQDELIEQDEELIEVQDELIEQDEELIEVQDEIIEQDEELIEVQDELIEQDEELIEVQDELIEEDEELIEVQDELIEEDEELIEVQDELIEQDEELIEVQDELIEEKVTTTNKSDKYSIFEYEPNKLEIFQVEIIAALKELEHKKPESNILKIIELKYKQNLSVEEIAKVLDKNVEQILEVLYEIIEIIKD